MTTVHRWWDAQSKQTRQTYRQSIQSTQTIYQEMEEDHNTKAALDEGVEKHSCQIELRGIHLKLVYYNGKFVCIHHGTCHCSPACEDRRRTR